MRISQQSELQNFIANSKVLIYCFKETFLSKTFDFRFRIISYFPMKRDSHKTHNLLATSFVDFSIQIF